jgi:hypothetical protein
MGMLKNLGYDGAYRDELISVSVLLENPLEHGLNVTALAFSVAIRAVNASAVMPRPEDFTFYIMDESDALHNAERSLYLKNAPDSDEPVLMPDMLIHTGFRHSFLFQDLRIAFYFRPYEKINIIGLKH